MQPLSHFMQIICLNLSCLLYEVCVFVLFEGCRINMLPLLFSSVTATLNKKIYQEWCVSHICTSLHVDFLTPYRIQILKFSERLVPCLLHYGETL